MRVEGKVVVGLMKKPFAWVSKGALGTKLRVLVLKIAYLEVNDRKWGLALVVQRSGKAGAFFAADRDRFEPTPQVSK